MPDLDLVFDFDGWKLNGLHIFSEPAAFAFLGAEDTPPTEVVVQPGLLERVKAGLLGRKAQEKRIVYSDSYLVYRKLGLWLEYNGNCICGFEIHVQADEYLQASSFPGRFVFGNDILDLGSASSFQHVKDIFGIPDEEDDESCYLTYTINKYELEFWFDDDQTLESIKGSIVDAEDIV
jgi:hypothetical protein